MNPPGFDAKDYAEQIVSLLWPGSGVSDGGSKTAGLLAFPSIRNARLLVPAANRKVAVTAARRYSVGTDVRSRLATAVLAQGLRSGAAQWAARRGCRLAGATSGPDTITARLREIVSPRCEVAVYVGLPRANRKPVLLVVEPDGVLSAVAKLSVSPLSHRLIANEAAALVRCAAAPSAHVTAARVLFEGEWAGAALLVQSALPEPAAEPSDAARRRELAAVEISRIGGIEQHRLGSSAFVEALEARIALLPDGDRALVSRAVARLREALPDVVFPVGSWHGDWTPWNAAASRSGGMLVWDWERFSPGVPAGFDALHYIAQARARTAGDPAAGLEAARAHLDTALSPFDVSADARLAVFALYLMEILVRYTEDGQARMAGGRRWVQALTAAVEGLLTDIVSQSPQRWTAT